MSSSDIVALARAICEAEKLRLADQLGQGSFKHVFLATDSDGVSYAVKIFHGTEISPRNQREIDALRQCDSPAIAKLIRLGAYPYLGRRVEYICEEYLPGGTLQQRIARDGNLNNQDVIELAIPLIEALQQLNSLGLVHRDIKPANILFRDAGNSPVLDDFGSVRILTAASLTETGLLAPLSPFFASPEQLTGQKDLIDWRSDQFSLGVTLCYARFGYHPYQDPGKNLAQERLLDQGRQSAAFIEATTTGRMKPLRRMTERWPFRRFLTPTALLDAWLGGER